MFFFALNFPAFFRRFQRRKPPVSLAPSLIALYVLLDETEITSDYGIQNEEWLWSRMGGFQLDNRFPKASKSLNL